MSAFNDALVDQLVTRINRLEKALIPFAEKEECEIGLIVGSDDDHTENCEECQRILFARAALDETI